MLLRGPAHRVVVLQDTHHLHPAHPNAHDCHGSSHEMHASRDDDAAHRTSSGATRPSRRSPHPGASRSAPPPPRTPPHRQTTIVARHRRNDIMAPPQHVIMAPPQHARVRRRRTTRNRVTHARATPHLQFRCAVPLEALERRPRGEVPRPVAVGAVRVGEEIIRLKGTVGTCRHTRTQHGPRTRPTTLRGKE